MTLAENLIYFWYICTFWFIFSSPLDRPRVQPRSGRGPRGAQRQPGVPWPREPGAHNGVAPRRPPDHPLQRGQRLRG